MAATLEGMDEVLLEVGRMQAKVLNLKYVAVTIGIHGGGTSRPMQPTPGMFVKNQRKAKRATNRQKKRTLSNLQLGWIHEFGAQGGHIPQRSFIRAPVDANHPRIERVCQFAVDAYMNRGKSAPSVLDSIGRGVRGVIVDAIDARIPPPNAASTIAAKGSDVPLIATGQMKAAITWRRVAMHP